LDRTIGEKEGETSKEGGRRRGHTKKGGDHQVGSRAPHKKKRALKGVPAAKEGSGEHKKKKVIREVEIRGNSKDQFPGARAKGLRKIKKK